MFSKNNLWAAAGRLVVRNNPTFISQNLSEFVDSFQPITQPTRTSVLYDFRVVWQSPRSCKLL